MLLGKDPSLKIAVVCYNSTVARGFNKNVQDIILSDEYRELFPDTIIYGVRDKKSVDKLKEKGRQLEKNSYMFETTEGGYLISVGVNGSLTSKTIDILIMDDLYKGPSDAWSSVYRERVWEFYNSVAETRLHNGSKQLLLYTRWHPDDLAGRLIKREPEMWDIIKYEGLKVASNKNAKDTREIGEALWPERHSKERLLRIKKNDEVTFESLIQQNPKPSKGLMYPNHKVYTNLPTELDSFIIRKAYIDTADTGEDFLAGIFYVEYDGDAYITDILYTKEPMEITEPITADMIVKNNTSYTLIESNNGGRGFARNVISECGKSGNFSNIEWFFQSNNKNARIYSNSAKVMNRVYFPADWAERWPEAYESFTNYMKEGKNDHDDFQDCITGVSESLPDYEIGGVML